MMAELDLEGEGLPRMQSEEVITLLNALLIELKRLKEAAYESLDKDREVREEYAEEEGWTKFVKRFVKYPAISAMEHCLHSYGELIESYLGEDGLKDTYDRLLSIQDYQYREYELNICWYNSDGPPPPPRRMMS